GVVALDRADQPQQAVRDEVAFVDVRGQAAAEPPGDVLDERGVREDQPVAEVLILRAAILAPQGLRVLRHGARILRATAVSARAARGPPSRRRSRRPRLRRRGCARPTSTRTPPPRSRRSRARGGQRARRAPGAATAPPCAPAYCSSS